MNDNSRPSRPRPHRPAHRVAKDLEEVLTPSTNGINIADAALDRLDELDEVIFSALQGDPEALNRSCEVWSTVSEQVQEILLEESRQHYAECAEAIWKLAEEENSLPRGFAALEVLTLLSQLDDYDAVA